VQHARGEQHDAAEPQGAVRASGDEEDDKSLKAYRALAKELKIHLHVGSLALKFSPEKAVNRSFLIAPDGAILACYDKIHMFDIDLPAARAIAKSPTTSRARPP
jgi:predicted amidohydrolase